MNCTNCSGTDHELSGCPWPSLMQMLAAADAYRTAKGVAESMGYDSVSTALTDLHERKAAPPAPVGGAEWQPIETAPKDGTAIDLWVDGEFSRRRPGCFWGLPHHCCGEMGSYCDSEWHDLEPGWVDDFNQPLSELDRKPTHWMPLPAEPGIQSAPLNEGGKGEGVRDALAHLVHGMRWWARQEDGIPAEVAPAFNQAMLVLGWSYSSQTDLDALAAEQSSEDKLYARRYRWLREQHWNEADMAVVCYPKESVKLGFDCPSGPRLDEAIDAAIAKGEA